MASQRAEPAPCDGGGLRSLTQPARHRLATFAALGACLGVLLTSAACATPAAPLPAPSSSVVVEAPVAPPEPEPAPVAPAEPQPAPVAPAEPQPAPVAPAEPQPAPFTLRELPRPSLGSILTAPHTTATLTDVHAAGRALLGVDGVAALVHPHARLTPGYAAPDATKPPILALEDTTLEQPATWLATAAEQDWIQVLVPLGRGGLPSDDPAAVNGCAVWVPSDGVDVTAARAVVVVSVSGRTAAITAPDGRTTTVSVGVGRENDTDTPRGLGSLVAFAATPAGLPVAVTSLQSTRLDGYDGASYAAFALHPDPEHGAAIGKARSNGCIRMDAGDFERLVDGVLPLGTPVWVVD